MALASRAEKSLETLKQTIQNLPADEKSVLQMLSVVYAPTSQTTLMNCLKRAELRQSSGKQYTGVAVGEIVARLDRAKLVKVGKSGFRCQPRVLHPATFSAVADGTFVSLARAVQAEIPGTSNWGGNYYRTEQHALRDVRIGFYRKDARYALDRAAQYLSQFQYEASACHPFVKICYEPFDPDWFRLLPEPLILAALNRILPYCLAHHTKSEAPFAIFSLLAEKPGASVELKGRFCLELLLRGRSQEAEQAADGASPFSTFLAVRGICALQRGEVEAAISCFDEALRLLRKETGKRKTFFDNIAGPLHILALIGSGAPPLIRQAEQHCVYVEKRRGWPEQPVYELLLLVLAEQQGARGVASRLEAHSCLSSFSAFYPLFLAMALYWCGSERAAEAAQQLLALARKAAAAGYLWLADEMFLAAAACGANSPEGAETAKRYRECGKTPLVRILRKSEPWENALNALIKLNRPEEPEAEKPPAETRLIWHVQDLGGSIEVQPREQKLSPKGKWSSGRNASLKRLAEECPTLDFVTEQDRQICGCIKAEREGYNYYGRELYRLDLERALPLMVGHPRLYLDPAGTVPLELVQGEPELKLATRGEMLQMTLFPPFKPERALYLLKESPTRIRLFVAKEEHRKIAAILGDGLSIPAEAKERALEAVQSLSSLLVVHSDIGAEGAETVPGDDTPCFHLLPYQEGVKLDLFVRPFAESGPYFRPGAGGETVLAELEGTRYQAKRDLRRECRRAAEAALALGVLAEAEAEQDVQWLVPDPEKALELLMQLQELGESVRVSWPEGARFKVTQKLATTSCRIAVRQARDWFELDGEVKLNEGLTLNLQQLLSLMKESSGRFVPMGQGEFLALSAEFRKKLEDLAGIGEAHGSGFRIHKLAAGAVRDFIEEAGEAALDQGWKDQLARLDRAAEVIPVVPSTLQAELRSYQEEGFAWLNRLAQWGVGACLADDMGLGKTVQALAQLLVMAAQGPSLVVAPTSVCANWESEAARFAPTLKVVNFGPGNRVECLKGVQPFDLVICSYGLLQQEGELLAAVQWQCVVLDEAQAIKNMATKRSQAAMQLCGAFKMVATGTPVENHLGELWNIFRFINPGLLGSLKQFNVKYAAPIEKSQDKKARARLKRLIQPFILRRTKSQVLEELPARTEIVMKVEMSEQEASLYEALRRDALENLSGVRSVEGKAQNHIRILAEIMRLRRACCNPRLVLPESRVESCKLAAFAEIVEELRENRHKALVFSQFVDHLTIIREYVEREGIAYQYLDGSTPAAERKKRVDAFQSGDGELFLISLKAGGVGLNLTAADYVIHMDPWWNPAVEDQASDRAHRIGQLRPVTIYRLVTKGTIEERIVGLHQQKRGLADSLLEESDLSGKVSAEELLALLRQQGSE